MDRFSGTTLCGTWNVRNLCRAVSLTTAAGELSKYKLHSVGLQVKWDIQWEYRSDGTEPACDYTVLYGNGNQNHELGRGLLVHER
jgi:hypothetical protein